MIIPSLLTSKKDLYTVTTSDTLTTALAIMEDIDQRCLPILDTSKTIYRGNIYRYHIYKHIAQGGSLDIPVSRLLKNAAKFIYVTDSFYKLFFTIGDLPYLSILDESHTFIGVVKHTDVMRFLAGSWQLANISYALSIAVDDFEDSLSQLLKIITRYTDPVGILTFQREDLLHRQFVIITLPNNISNRDLQKMTHRLSKKQFKIINTESFHGGV